MYINKVKKFVKLCLKMIDKNQFCLFQNVNHVMLKFEQQTTLSRIQIFLMQLQSEL